MKVVFQKSLVSSKELEKGHCLSFDDFAFKKPGDGIPAHEWKNFVGKVLNKSVKKDYKFNCIDFV